MWSHKLTLGSVLSVERRARGLEVRGFEDALPLGLPRASVIEVSAAHGLATATSFALSACGSAQAEARQRGAGDTLGAFVAWVDAASSLHAPAVARAGVDLERLLVVRPPAPSLARVALRLVESRAFALVVIDLAGVPGASIEPALARWGRVVRRLSIALEGTETAAVLLTDSLVSRALPLPVAMRIELRRELSGDVWLGVGKDRRGSATAPRLAKVGEGLFERRSESGPNRMQQIACCVCQRATYCTHFRALR